MEWPLLESLTAQERSAFLALARRRRFAREDVVCREGEVADSLHLVESGRLAVSVGLASGESAMINVLGPGGYFGELALLRPDGHRTATVTALEAVATLAVPAGAFRRLRSSHPGVERAMTALLAHRVERLSERLVESLYVGLDQRVVRRLLDLCELYGSADASRTVVPLTQRQLAELTGGTRPSVNQALKRLADQGVVAVHRGRIEVLDRRQLERSSRA